MSVGKCKQRSDLQIYKSTNHMYIPLLWPVSVLNSNKHHRQTIYNRSHKLRTERQSKFQGRIAMVFEWMYYIKMDLNRTHKESSRNTSEGNENQISHYREQTLKWKGIINRKGLWLSISRDMAVTRQASAHGTPYSKSRATELMDGDVPLYTSTTSYKARTIISSM